ncbi:DUF192 domain-containing protein [Candidatus Woesearchaeota archaeon]|nr:DUF192 domain-containing protein [Candidatus Woesearchaeota archaeon]
MNCLWHCRTLFFLFLFLVVVSSCTPTEKNQVSIVIEAPRIVLHTENGTTTVSVEIADTLAEQQQGLMYRTALEQNKGMLFIFAQAREVGFWMKNTKIPLDMLFIDSNKTIFFIEHNAQPCIADPCPTYGPNAPVQYVLEMNGGFAKEKHIKVGDKISFLDII